jgi:enamine deaminase RidA (YjgF/YER057c/UK114 family)
MANLVAHDIKLNKFFYSPEAGSTLHEKLLDCYRQFVDGCLDKSLLKQSVIKQTIFIEATDQTDYLQKKEKILLCAKEFLGQLPPTSVLAQTPENGTIAVEFVLVEGLLKDEICHKRNSEVSWLVIQRGGSKILVASNLGESKLDGDILFQSEKAFKQLNDILVAEGMEFSDIVRQWNYIEQITEIFDEEKSPSQHYQIFNDVRTKYYHKSIFKNGFPAATGIGSDFGGIIIDVIAAKIENKNSIIAVKSPVQLDAYTYSEKVLAENNLRCDFCRSTPKFERAKILITPEKKWIFISGTAAIIGQDSSEEMLVGKQTEMTIQNILRLISTENLKNHGFSGDEKADVMSLRVYVKFRNDIPEVKKVCKRYFPDLRILYVVADICRPELLVEIEGVAVLN